jgi:ATP-dependent DNA helicase RecG
MLRPQRLDPLFAPATTVPGIGPAVSKTLSRLFDHSQEPRVLDLAFHMPATIVDRRLRTTVSKAPVGSIATLTVEIEDHRRAPPGRRGSPHRVIASDATGDIVLVYFVGDPSWVERMLPVGTTRIISGRVDIYDGIKQIAHPDHVVSPEQADKLPELEPVYPLTEGLSARVLTRAIHSAVERVPDLPEWIDPDFRSKRQWPAFREALHRLHNPLEPGDADPSNPAATRLAYDELFTGQVALGLVRGEQKRGPGQAMVGTGVLVQAIRSSLPFALTGAQARATAEIHADMARPERMMRLLQGDVGSGKTVVALLAMARAAEAGFQSVLMAPTEILARQHAASLQRLAAVSGLKVGLLTGREKGKERAALLADLASGDLMMLVGTHAVFQQGVAFHRLGLAIVDEQHRFGVEQRLALASKGSDVDLLVMTATPIPRTLVLTYYGDMDVSRLDEKPPGRKPIDTRVLPLERLFEVVEGVGRAIQRGDRVYWICPLVSESEHIDLAAAEERHEALAQHFGASVGLLHGKMAGGAKDAALGAFQRGETTILVATTVVEVGVDVPEASIIVIEHAERFGLAQLHQLRGRVGRGERASTCLLLYQAPLGEIAASRLSALRDSQDGFVLAEEDLKLRGPGEVLGRKQSGLPDTRFVRFEVHSDLVAIARDDARVLLSRDPELKTPRGEAARMALHLFGQFEAIRLLDAG